LWKAASATFVTNCKTHDAAPAMPMQHLIEQTTEAVRLLRKIVQSIVENFINPYNRPSCAGLAKDAKQSKERLE